MHDLHRPHSLLPRPFPGLTWSAVAHRPTYHDGRSRKTWSPSHPDTWPLYGRDVWRADRGPARWPPNVILTAQMVNAVEIVKAACRDRGEKREREEWDAVCAARWLLNFNANGRPYKVQPAAPEGWRAVEGGKKAGMAGEKATVEGEEYKSEVAETAGLARERLLSVGGKSRWAVPALPGPFGRGSRFAGGDEEQAGAVKRKPEDWRIDDGAHKRLLSDIQGSITRLKKSYDAAKKEKGSVPPHVREEEARRLAELEENASKDAARIKELETQAEQSGKQIQEHEDEKKTLTQSIQQLESKISESDKECERLEKLYKTREKRVAELRTMLTARKSKMDEMASSATQSELQLKDQRAKVEQLQSDNEELRTQGQKDQSTISNLETVSATSASKIIELEEQLKQHESSVNELQVENKKNHKSMMGLRAQLVSQQTKINQLEGKYKASQSQAWTLQSQSEKDHAQFHKTKGHCTELSSKLETAAQRERRLEESLGFVATTLLEFIQEDSDDTAKVEANSKASSEDSAGIMAEQAGLEQLLEQLLSGPNSSEAVR